MGWNARYLPSCSRSGTASRSVRLCPPAHRIALAVGSILLTWWLVAGGEFVGYDKASAVAHHAMEHDLTLKDPALQLGHAGEDTFEHVADPEKMVKPHANKGELAL
jgi:fumarate hydratase class II